jgi:hypothetical protein
LGQGLSEEAFLRSLLEAFTATKDPNRVELKRVLNFFVEILFLKDDLFEVLISLVIGVGGAILGPTAEGVGTTLWAWSVLDNKIETREEFTPTSLAAGQLL